jgi:hypothetical protein
MVQPPKPPPVMRAPQAPLARAASTLTSSWGTDFESASTHEQFPGVQDPCVLGDDMPGARCLFVGQCVRSGVEIGQRCIAQ